MSRIIVLKKAIELKALVGTPAALIDELCFEIIGYRFDRVSCHIEHGRDYRSRTADVGLFLRLLPLCSRHGKLTLANCCVTLHHIRSDLIRELLIKESWSNNGIKKGLTLKKKAINKFALDDFKLKTWMLQAARKQLLAKETSWINDVILSEFYCFVIMFI